MRTRIGEREASDSTRAFNIHSVFKKQLDHTGAGGACVFRSKLRAHARQKYMTSVIVWYFLTT